jgi:hypothetical protein
VTGSLSGYSMSVTIDYGLGDVTHLSGTVDPAGTTASGTWENTDGTSGTWSITPTPPAGPAVDVSGSWDTLIDGAAGEAVVLTMAGDGTITGTSGSGTVTGSLSGYTIELSIDYGSGDVTDLSGTVNPAGTTASGTWENTDGSSGDWSITPTPPASPAVDVSGSWDTMFDGTAHDTVILAMAFDGTITGMWGTYVTTGGVTGYSIEMSIAYAPGGVTDLSGTVDPAGDSASGTWVDTDGTSGAWSISPTPPAVDVLDVSGSWDTMIDGVADETVILTMAFDGAVTGTSDTGTVTTGSITGYSMNITIDHGSGDVTHFSGIIDPVAATASGTWENADGSTGAWSITPTPPAADVTGTWDVTVDGESVDPVILAMDAEGLVTGTSIGETIAGRVSGYTMNLIVDDGSGVLMHFSGTLNVAETDAAGTWLDTIDVTGVWTATKN